MIGILSSVSRCTDSCSRNGRAQANARQHQPSALRRAHGVDHRYRGGLRAAGGALGRQVVRAGTGKGASSRNLLPEWAWRWLADLLVAGEQGTTKMGEGTRTYLRKRGLIAEECQEEGLFAPLTVRLSEAGGAYYAEQWAVSAEAESFSLIVSIERLETAPALSAEVVWDDPSGYLEGEWQDGPVPWSLAAGSQLLADLPRLIQVFAAAVERGKPSA